MKLKVDYSGFNESEIEFVRTGCHGMVDTANPFYLRMKLYYYNTETKSDEVITIEGSSIFMPYYMKTTLKKMSLKGYSLPYKTETQKITDESEIAPLRDYESNLEL